jgi:hypothetical protein
MPIFLFNYNSRQLHGIFRAVSDGDWKINPHGGSRTCSDASVMISDRACSAVATMDNRMK